MIHIEIWSDVVCPFCYIGKRRLEQALEQFEGRDQVQVEWKSFLLNPDVQTDPAQSINAHLAEQKGWTPEYTREVQQYVTDMAAGVGLAYDFDKVVVANSIRAHRLLQMAKRQQKGDEMKEALLRAYFVEGRNIDDPETLTEIARQAGMDAAEVRSLAEEDMLFRTQVFADVREAQSLGVRGVPFFVFDRTYGISGAQPTEAFLSLLNKIQSEQEVQQIQQPAGDENACDVNGNC